MDKIFDHLFLICQAIGWAFLGFLFCLLLLNTGHLKSFYPAPEEKPNLIRQYDSEDTMDEKIRQQKEFHDEIFEKGNK